MSWKNSCKIDQEFPRCLARLVDKPGFTTGKEKGYSKQNMKNYDPSEENGGNGINRLVLSDQVKQYILDGIGSGEFTPGERLVESQLARQLGISQAPVREAIRDLVSIGFLEREPHKGAVVRLLTDDDMVEIYTVRGPLDALAAELAAPRIKDDHLRSLTEIKDLMIERALAKDFISAARLDWQFHIQIVDVSGNKLLRRIYDNLQLDQYILITMRRSSQSLEDLASRHQSIIDALKTRDPEVARNVTMAHIEGLWPSSEKTR
jgi:DNA-binding GntR family transcriptional regulator